MFNNYAADGFARSYANGGTWDYLASRFGVEERPADIDSTGIFSGSSQLDRKDVAFHTEIGISEHGIYVNVNVLGRIFVPWDSISTLQKNRVSTEEGSQTTVSLGLDNPKLDFDIPWQSELDQLVPKFVGIN